MNHIEDSEQMTLFEWAHLQSGKYPELVLLFHIPNGGKRDAREAARFKKMGVKPVFPICSCRSPRAGLTAYLSNLKQKAADYQTTKQNGLKN